MALKKHSPYQGPQRRLYLGLALCCFLLLLLLLDSTWLAQSFDHSQWMANAITIAYFLWLYRRGSRRIKSTMRYAVVISTGGEVFLSLVLGMYEYRLENVPIYVPLGHAILYATVWYLTHDPWVVRKQAILMPVLLCFTLAYTLLLLFNENDTYGAICTVLLLVLLWLNPRSRRFFLIMFLAVAYLEQLGTFLGCWYWQPTLLDQPGWISSSNPPSGISLAYFVLDMLCLGAYLLRHPKTSRRWRKAGSRDPKCGYSGK